MLTVNEKENLVIAQKIKPRLAPESIMDNQKRSYNQFLEKGVYKVVDEFCQMLSEKTNKEWLGTIRICDKMIDSFSNKEWKRSLPQYYTVYAQFSIDNERMNSEVELFKIPYSDSYNILNVGGSKKVLIGSIEGLEDISFERKDSSLFVNLVLPSYKFRIHVNNKGVYFLLNGKNHSAAEVLEAMYYEIGSEKRVHEIFSNSFVLTSMTNPEYMAPETIYDVIKEKRLLHVLKRNIGPLRRNLNELLTLNSSMNEELAEPVVVGDKTIPAGTIIGREHLTLFRKNNVNCIYIKRQPVIAGKYTFEPIHIDMIPRGTTVSPLVKDLIPSFKDYRYVPMDTGIDYVIPAKTKLTPDMMDLIYSCGFTEIQTLKSKSDATPLTIPFKQEVLTNQSRKVTEDDPQETLTVHDLAALVSYSVRVYTGQVTDTYNRDKDFLKKISFANEIFTNTLLRAFLTHINKPGYSRQILEYVISDIKGYVDSKRDNPFRGLSSTWKETLGESKLLRIIEDVNPIALLSQITRVASIVHSKNGVSDSQRTLALPFYGRICPYETPQGATIGLVNHLAVGCNVRDSIPMTTYFPIIRENGNKFRIDYDNPIELSSKEELKKKRIGDLMSLELDDNGYIVNKKVIARIPASDGSDERMSVASVDATTLNFVNAIPEQHLSPATMMIPFAGADDGARVQFGISLLKHSLYLKDSEIPHVVTGMYSDIYKYIGYYTIRAERDGVVVAIDTNMMVVQYEGDAHETYLEFKESQVSNKSITTLSIRIGIGETFKKDEILVDSSISRDGYFSPGRNALVVYICDDGWNYEDAIVVSETTSHDFTSLGVDIQKRSFKEDKKLRKSNRNIKLSNSNLYTYVNQGGTLAEIITSRPNEPISKSNIEKITSKAKGILYDLTIESKPFEKTLIATLVSFNKLNVADKLSGRHGNKGVGSIIKPNSEMPQFLNGVTADMVLNPCGVVSRMNIGQLLEAHLGFIGYLLGLRFQSDSFNGASTEEIRRLMNFVYDLANGASDSEVRSKYGRLIPEFVYERAQERIDFIRDWEGCFTPSGSARMYNPVTGKMFENNIAFGYAYMIKTTEEVEHKMHARSGPLDGSEYLRTTKQPTEGSSKGGGQRIGEMELAVLAAHGATEVIYEMLNVKSDDVPQRINMSMELLGLDPIFEEDQYITRSNDIFRYYMEAGGVYVESDAIPGYSSSDIESRKDFDFKALRKRSNYKSNNTERERNKAVEMELEEVDLD